MNRVDLAFAAGIVIAVGAAVLLLLHEIEPPQATVLGIIGLALMAGSARRRLCASPGEAAHGRGPDHRAELEGLPQVRSRRPSA
jgi:hypothetical protein